MIGADLRCSSLAVARAQPTASAKRASWRRSAQDPLTSPAWQNRRPPNSSATEPSCPIRGLSRLAVSSCLATFFVLTERRTNALVGDCKQQARLAKRFWESFLGSERVSTCREVSQTERVVTSLFSDWGWSVSVRESIIRCEGVVRHEGAGKGVRRILTGWCSWPGNEKARRSRNAGRTSPLAPTA